MKCEAKIFPRFNELTENLVKRKNLECLLFVRSPILAGRPRPQRFVPMDKIFFREETNRSHLVWSTDDRILGSVLGLGFLFYGCLVFHVL